VFFQFFYYLFFLFLLLFFFLLFSSYFFPSGLAPSYFPSGLAPRREKVACPTPLKGLQPNLSSTVIEASLTLSTRRTPLGSSLPS
jgi:hypothetical protein